MPGKEHEFRTPVWFKKWKMAVAVVSGLMVFFAGGVMARPYLELGMTVDARARMDTFEERLDKLVTTVENLTKTVVVVAAKEYETDKELILLVIEAYEKRQTLAQGP